MINIVLAADNKYIQHCITTITSILENTRSKVHFYILTSGFDLISTERLGNLEIKYNCVIQAIFVNEKDLENAPLPDSLGHINIVTYYRILIPKLIPLHINKVIYLDCDIIVRKDIEELWQIDLENNALGAVYQTPLMHNNDIKRLNIKENYGYFNAGVLIFNLKIWREHEIMEKCLNYLKTHHKMIFYHDQDILNAILYDKTKSLPFKWNLMNYYFFKTNYWKKRLPKLIIDKIIEAQNNPTLIHYTYYPKPWNKNCNHPYRNEYFYYANKNIKNINIPKDSLLFIFKRHISRIIHYFISGGYINL